MIGGLIVSDYPSHYFITSGSGIADDELVSFDKALIDADISNYNLVRISSILPIGAERAESIDLIEGSPLLTAYGTMSCGESGTMIASAIAIGIPKDIQKVGVIMEFSGKCTKEVALDKVRNMAEQAMQNHGIALKKIISSGIDEKCSGKGVTTVISAVAIWR